MKNSLYYVGKIFLWLTLFFAIFLAFMVGSSFIREGFDSSVLFLDLGIVIGLFLFSFSFILLSGSENKYVLSGSKWGFFVVFIPAIILSLIGGIVELNKPTEFGFVVGFIFIGAFVVSWFTTFIGAFIGWIISKFKK